MNYLAHAALSFKQPDILVGNMISDFVKGKKKFGFDEGIQKGIMLHRSIDAFTDAHETTKQAKEFFKPSVGLYAGAFVDVAYDHFLACDENEFTDESLFQFSLFVYDELDKYQQVMPEKFSKMFAYMKKDNWLYHYKTINGAGKSFAGLAHRAAYLNNSTEAFAAFKENYDALHQIYLSFFPLLKNFAAQSL